MLTSAEIQQLADAADAFALEVDDESKAYLQALARKARDHAAAMGYTPSTDTSTTTPF